jgi:hypothetical protein
MPTTCAQVTAQGVVLVSSATESAPRSTATASDRIYLVPALGAGITPLGSVADWPALAAAIGD